MEAMSELSDAEFRECIERIANYSFNGIKEPGSTPIVRAILSATYPNVDSAKKNHLKAIENGKKGKEYGRRGGRPRNGETKEEAYERRNGNPSKPLDIDNNKDIEIDRDTNIEIDRNTAEENLNPDYECQNVFDISSLQGYQDHIDSSSMGFDYMEPQQPTLPITEPMCDSKFISESCESRGDLGDGAVAACHPTIDDLEGAIQMAKATDRSILSNTPKTEQAKKILQYGDAQGSICVLFSAILGGNPNVLDYALEQLLSKTTSCSYDDIGDFDKTIASLYFDYTLSQFA